METGPCSKGGTHVWHAFGRTQTCNKCGLHHQEWRRREELKVRQQQQQQRQAGAQANISGAAATSSAPQAAVAAANLPRAPAGTDVNLLWAHYQQELVLKHQYVARAAQLEHLLV